MIAISNRRFSQHIINLVIRFHPKKLILNCDKQVRKAIRVPVPKMTTRNTSRPKVSIAKIEAFQQVSSVFSTKSIRFFNIHNPDTNLTIEKHDQISFDENLK